MYLINHKYIKEVEARTKDNSIEEIIGEAIDLLIEVVVKVTEVKEEIEVTLGEEHFEEEVIFEEDMIIIGMDRRWENRILWRQSRSKERERRSRSLSSSRSGSRIRTNRDRIRCFKCREYDHFANECPMQTVDSSDRDSDSARSASLCLANSDAGSDTDHYLNI